MGKKSLGRDFRGLLGENSGIIQEIAMNSSRGDQLSIPISQIDPNPHQPRTRFSEGEIAELAETIQKHGLLQPIAVRKKGGEGRYELIAGERRLRACQSLGMETIAALVKERISNRQMAELAIIENIQRVDLTPVEEARAFQQLIGEHDYTHDTLSQTLGRSRSSVTNALRLLQLPDEVLEWIGEGKLSAGHARALLGGDVADPVKLALEVIRKGWSVRQTEEAAKQVRKQIKKRQRKGGGDPSISALERELTEKLGTAVRISHKNGSGSIEITFSSHEEFNRLRERLSR